MESSSTLNQTSQENNIHLQETATLSTKTLIAVSILLFYTIVSSIISKFKLKILHESGLSMILGILISMTAYFFNPNVILASYLIYYLLLDIIFFCFVL